MYENFYAVIMAGGSGTRLWPLSRRNRPKQSLAIIGERTLFQHAVDRLEGLFPFERILVVTVADQVDLLSKECPDIPAENFIIEPLPRGTASVVGLASIALRQHSPNSSMAILTADHLIKNDRQLRDLLRSAYDVAQDDYLVTLGITPTFPATGYGYIQKGDELGEFQNMIAYSVKKFKEKPKLQQAEKLVSDGQHVWNSGMFIWRVDLVLAEFQQQMPDLFQKLMQIDEKWQTNGHEATLNQVWPTIEPQTIDYGIMENAEKVAVIPANNLGWHDVGSWESLFEALDGDDAGNIVLGGENIAVDTQGTLICEDSTGRLIVTIGVEDLIIIDSGNAVLVADRKQSQRVREIVDYLQQQKQEDYL